MDTMAELVAAVAPPGPSVLARAPSLTPAHPALASADDSDSNATLVVLADPVCLSTLFAGLDGASLGRCAAVCRLWRDLLCRDVGADAAIWRASYLADYGREPLPHEWLGSYRAMYARAAGLLALPAPSVLPISGSAVCYSPGSHAVVTFAPHAHVLSALGPDGRVRSTPVPDRGITVGVAPGRPFLSPLPGDLIILSTGDGMLQLWDARRLVPAGTLGAHSGPLTSLSADGDLVGSTCASELRLWEIDMAAAAAAARAAAAATAAAAAAARASSQCGGGSGGGSGNGDQASSSALPATASVLSPQQQLLEAARTPVGRLLSSTPIGLPMPSPVLEPSVVVCSASRLAALSNCTAPLPSSVVRVYCARADSAGTLLRELPVNAAADMAFAPGRLMVAAAFHGRSLGGPERAFTVVVHCWDTDSWAWSRLVSPRLSTPFPVTSAQGLPLIHVTQDWLLCAVPTRSESSPIPTCMVNAWRLPRATAAGAAEAAAARAGDRALRLRAGDSASGSPQRPQQLLHQQQDGTRNNSSGSGQGVVAGSSQPATMGPGQRAPVFLIVGDSEGHDPWLPVLSETGPGFLSVLTSAPNHLLLATPEGQVRAATICSAVPLPPAARRSPAF